MKSYIHDHITQEVIRVAEIRKDFITSNHNTRCFAATLRDGTYLPCVTAVCREMFHVQITPDKGKPFLKFDAANLGLTCYSTCIIDGDYVESVEPSPYLLPQHLCDALAASEFKGSFTLKVEMRDGQIFTLTTGDQLLFFRPPEGYSWLDVVNAECNLGQISGQRLYPMVAFKCLLAGLPEAVTRSA